MNANAAYDIHTFIVPLVLATFTVGVVIGSAIFQFVKLIRSGEPVLSLTPDRVA